MVRVVQYNIPAVIIMSSHYAFLMPCDPSHGNGAWLDAVDSYRLSQAHRRELQANFFGGNLFSASDLSIGCIVPSSLVCYVHSAWIWSCFIQIRIIVSGVSYSSVPFPLSVIMVRSGRSRRSRERRDNGLPSSTCPVVEPEQAPLNPPPPIWLGLL